MKNTFIMAILLMICIACENEETHQLSNPVALFETNTETVKEGNSVILTDKSFDQNGKITKWLWDFGNGTTSTEQNPTYIYPEIGEYTITLNVTDNEGNKSKNTYTKKIVVYTNSGSEPEVVWEYEVPYYSTHSSLAVANNGTVYVCTDAKASNPDRGNNVIAVKNGTKVWENVTNEVIRSTPAVANDGTIYIGDYEGVLKAYNTDGTEKWSANLGKRVKYSAPAIASDGTIYIGLEDDNKLVAVNPIDGTEKWTFSVDNDIRATPVIDKQGTIYVASSDDYFYAINSDGTLKWKTIYGDYTSGTPAISESKGVVYLTGKTSNNTGHLIAFNMSDGTIKWDNDTRLLAKMEQGSPVIATDGTIYAGGEDKKMVAYNSDGTVKWEFETFDKVLGAAALDNEGNIYFGDSSGFFYVLNPKGEKEWKSVQLGENIRSSAVIGNDGKIYILIRDNTNKKGKIVALKTEATGAMDSEWPMLSNNSRHTGRK